MTWAEVADDFSTWTIPASRAKNGATQGGGENLWTGGQRNCSVMK
jgi:hypothetical protein